MSAPALVKIGDVLRRGDGVAVDGSCAVPFTLPGEMVEVAQNGDEAKLLRVMEASAQRVEPGCPHFGVCGGCQLQMASADEQLRMKRDVLVDWFAQAGVSDLPDVQVHSGEPWGYRNRIRLRVGRDEAGALRLGYNERASRRFLPVGVCPISAPMLWRAAETLLAGCERASEFRELREWLEAATEVELFADDKMERLQVFLLLDGKAPGKSASKAESMFVLAMEALRATLPELAGAGTMLLGPAARGRESSRERTRTPVANWGAAGLAYEVSGERYWISRGGFFQVNRFLLPELVQLVCEGRSGSVAWDLFAGVGLFSRVLARNFSQVTAVEGSPVAAKDLGSALAKLGKKHRAVESSTLEFLQAAVVQRERPELVVLDPPRAGVSEEACELLLRVGAAEVVYVSCDPETLARDLAVLQRGYRVTALHLLDLFPQTYHQETVVMLERRGSATPIECSELTSPSSPSGTFTSRGLKPESPPVRFYLGA